MLAYVKAMFTFIPSTVHCLSQQPVREQGDLCTMNCMEELVCNMYKIGCRVVCPSWLIRKMFHFQHIFSLSTTKTFLTSNILTSSHKTHFCHKPTLDRLYYDCWLLNLYFLSLSVCVCFYAEVQRNFTLFQERDPFNLLQCVLKELHRDCFHGDKHHEHSVKSTLISQTFGGNLNSQLKCKFCSKVSHLHEYVEHIVLDIKHVTNVTSALKRHFSQRIESDVDCESCDAKYDYHAHSIHDPPNVLTLVLKRFDKSVNGKIDKNVKFSKELDLRRYLTHPCKAKLMYKLYAAIVHTGEDCTSGSYLSYVKV
uniref:ubiquitin carboxyl-terminal hydrolase 17-like protein D n=1 Tax=Myxine glutinosa TaxID=7769 RepID=UPI0035900F89